MMPKLNINRIDFEKHLRAALQNNFFNFEGKMYQQINGVAMGSPLGPTLTNTFLCFHEQICLNECPDELFCFFCLIILRNSKVI